MWIRFLRIELISAMVGREVYPAVSQAGGSHWKTALEVKGLYKKDTLRDISFDVEKGEISGLQGQGWGGDVPRCVSGICGLLKPGFRERYAINGGGMQP